MTRKIKERTGEVQDVGNLKFTVDVRKDPDDGLVHVDCRELQGCHTFGESETEALEGIADVIMDHLDARLRNGLKAGLRPSHADCDDNHSHVIEFPA